MRTNDVRWRGAGLLLWKKPFTFWGLIANGRLWSAPKPIWPCIPARKSGAFWLFHVLDTSQRSDLNPG